MYFHDCKEDGRVLRCLIIFLWILDTIHLAFTSHGLYFYLVTSFGDYAVLLAPTWAILAQVYVTNLSDLIVRGFFAIRVSILCGERRLLGIVLPVIITVLSLTVFSFGCGFASRSFILKTYAKMNEASYMLYASFATAVVADTLVAVSLCTLLIQSRTGFRRTDSIVTKLMAFSINTGLLTSIAAIACFVTYAIWPQRFIFMGIYFALSKLYVNSLLASLNARSSLRSQSTEVSNAGSKHFTPITFPMKDMSFSRETQNSEAA
ncbi:hypothetical protein BDN70DRAFT_515464 [Pholiota conissans]|uniref:DUF6534 domain-containing protein n=1 Tax=Pholiota conissans TaxID=109636 RepID=A0A9P6CMP5_9AGAR|nr:hypothetical protein BDN70DRAFT_515464 [Pholiota conissans]